MKVCVVKQGPNRLEETQLTVMPQTALGQLFDANGIEVPAGWSVSVWGDLCSSDYILQEDDRIEISAPLIIDPKKARIIKAKRAETHSGSARKHAKNNLKN